VGISIVTAVGRAPAAGAGTTSTATSAEALAEGAAALEFTSAIKPASTEGAAVVVLGLADWSFVVRVDESTWAIGQEPPPS
jgi:hypothetical protein